MSHQLIKRLERGPVIKFSQPHVALAGGEIDAGDYIPAAARVIAHQRHRFRCHGNNFAGGEFFDLFA